MHTLPISRVCINSIEGIAECHYEIPEILQSNLLLFNRIVGSADEMASLINNLSKDWCEKEINYKKTIQKQEEEIKRLKSKMTWIDVHN